MQKDPIDTTLDKITETLSEEELPLPKAAPTLDRKPPFPRYAKFCFDRSEEDEQFELGFEQHFRDCVIANAIEMEIEIPAVRWTVQCQACAFRFVSAEPPYGLACLHARKQQHPVEVVLRMGDHTVRHIRISPRQRTFMDRIIGSSIYQKLDAFTESKAFPFLCAFGILGNSWGYFTHTGILSRGFQVICAGLWTVYLYLYYYHKRRGVYPRNPFWTRHSRTRR